MFYKTKGIVFHTLKYSETSVIAKIYTEKLGLQSYMVKGVRSSKSKGKAALLQPLTLLEMEVSHRENKNLQFIKEYRRAYNYNSIPFDTLKGTIALFLLEVMSKSIREHEENSEMFDFVYHMLVALDESNKLNPDFHLLFLVHFTRHLGFMPHGNWSDKNCYFEMSDGVFTPAPGALMNYTIPPEPSQWLYLLVSGNPFQAASLSLNRIQRKELLNYLIIYYRLHIENFSLRSPAILEELLD